MKIGDIALKRGDIYINAYGQEVEIREVNQDEIVFIWKYQDSVDVMDRYDFAISFKKV